MTLSRIIIAVALVTLSLGPWARADVEVLKGESTANRGGVEITPTPTPSSPFERTDIRRTAAAGGPTTRSATGATSPTGWDLGKVPAALAAVVVLILGLRYLGKGILPGAAAGKGSRAVRLVSRTVIGPKQQVMLIQVGRRLVLVGAGGSGEMNPLCQITDADEVAEVLSQAKGASVAAPSSAPFGTAMSRASGRYEPSEDADAGRVEAPEAAEQSPELAGLMARVRRMSEKFQQT